MEQLIMSFDFEKENEILKTQLSMIDKNNGRVNLNYYLISKILSDEGINLIKNYVRKKNINSIILYGTGVVGKVLFDSLLTEKIVEVAALIDQSIESIFSFGKKEIISISDFESKLLSYDVIIVTPVLAFKDICSKLENLQAKEIVSVFDMLN